MENESLPHPHTALELRSDHRFLAQWRIAIVFKGSHSQTFYGLTHDIGLAGICMHSDHNLYSKEPVTILLAIPPLHRNDRKKVIEAEARIVYTILSSGQKGFRIGIEFLRFKPKDEAILRKHLHSRFRQWVV